MANYSADIRIGVVGKNELTNLDKQLTKINSKVKAIQKGLNFKSKVQTLKVNTKGATTAIKNLEAKIARLGRTVEVKLKTTTDKASGSKASAAGFGGGGGLNTAGVLAGSAVFKEDRAKVRAALDAEELKNIEKLKDTQIDANAKVIKSYDEASVARSKFIEKDAKIIRQMKDVKNLEDKNRFVSGQVKMTKNLKDAAKGRLKDLNEELKLIEKRGKALAKEIKATTKAENERAKGSKNKSNMQGPLRTWKAISAEVAKVDKRHKEITRDIPKQEKLYKERNVANAEASATLSDNNSKISRQVRSIAGQQENYNKLKAESNRLGKIAVQNEKDLAAAQAKTAANQKRFAMWKKGAMTGGGVALASAAGNLPVVGDAVTGGLVAGLSGGSVAAGALAGGLVGVGVALVGLTADVTKFNNQLDLSRIALANTVATSDEYAQALEAIRGISDDFLVPIDDVTVAFTKLNASMRVNGFNVGEVEEAYRGLAAANLALGGNAERLQGIMLATQQVFSKGSVQAEELRGQLGERLVGAFGLFAESAKMSTRQLDKEMKKGKITVQDFQEFVRYLLTKYEDDAEKIASAPSAAAIRLQKSMSNLKEALGPILTGIGNMFITLADIIVKQATRAANAWNNMVDKGIEGQVQAARAALENTRSTLEQMKLDHKEQGGKDILFGVSQQEIDTVERMVQAQEKNLKKAEERLKRLRGTQTPSGDPLNPKPPETPEGKTAAELAAEEKKGKAAAAAYERVQSKLKAEQAELITMKELAVLAQQLRKAEFEGNKAQIIRLNALKEEINLRARMKQELEGIEDAATRQVLVDKFNVDLGEIKADAAHELLQLERETNKEASEAAADKLKAFNEQKNSLEEALRYETAETEQMREQLRLEDALQSIRANEDLDDTQKNALTGLETKLSAARQNNMDPIKQYMDALEDSFTNTDQMIINTAELIRTELGGAFADSIIGFIKGTVTVEEAFASMLDSIGQELIRQATQLLVNKAVHMLLSAILNGGGGGGAPGVSNPGAFNIGKTATFSGGGYTGGGARAGGVDGQGGFPAILHPQETVIDHTSRNPYSPGNSSSSGPGAPINVNYTGPQLRFNGDDYVPKSAVPELISSAAKAGAREGQARTMNTLRNSRSQRSRIGV